MEIEKKYLIHKLPENLETYPRKKIQQAYLCTNPVVRIRKQDEEYILTYKGKGLMVREEYNLPLNRDAYEHLLQKADGIVLTKTRYLLPLPQGLTIELDVFDAPYENLRLAEVEFSSEEEANSLFPANITTACCPCQREHKVFFIFKKVNYT